MVAGETARGSLLGCRQSAKRKRALLESNPPRNTRPGTHRKMTPRVPGSQFGTRFCPLPFDRFPHASENSGGAGAGPRLVLPAIPLGAGWVTPASSALALRRNPWPPQRCTYPLFSST